MTDQRIGYIRVSSADQNPDRQLEGIKVERIFFDKSSGSDVKRPKLIELLYYIRDGDVLFVHSMDRLARNLTDLRKIVNDLTNTGVKIRFIKEGLEFSGDDCAMATLMLSVMGVVVH